jgi:hypothetical protein
METLFICTDCGAEHHEPADARLGHRVICVVCMTANEIALLADVGPPVAPALAA